MPLKADLYRADQRSRSSSRRNLYLTHERKVARKIKEALLAIWLEQELSKDEILSAYMNRVYLGSGTYGFDAAAQLYFGKVCRGC